MNALNLTTVDISSDRKRLVILDQTLLPNEIKYLELDDRESIYEAIKKLRVRGAPAIGVAAAYGIYVRHAKNIVLEDVSIEARSMNTRECIVCEDAEVR